MYDLSVAVSPQIAVYPGEPTPALAFRALLERGDPFTGSILTLSSHTGTHVDAPAHFLAGGKTIDQLLADRFCGKATVVDLTHLDRPVEAQDLKDELVSHSEILLVKTRASQIIAHEKRFERGLPVLSLGAARWIVDRKLKAVGIDNLSIEAGDAEHRVHKTLFIGDVEIIEGLDLADVPAGTYELVCLPLRVVGAEAAPCRALLYPLSS